MLTVSPPAAATACRMCLEPWFCLSASTKRWTWARTVPRRWVGRGCFRAVGWVDGLGEVPGRGGCGRAKRLGPVSTQTVVAGIKALELLERGSLPVSLQAIQKLGAALPAHPHLFNVTWSPPGQPQRCGERVFVGWGPGCGMRKGGGGGRSIPTSSTSPGLQPASRRGETSGAGACRVGWKVELGWGGAAAVPSWVVQCAAPGTQSYTYPCLSLLCHAVLRFSCAVLHYSVLCCAAQVHHGRDAHRPACLPPRHQAGRRPPHQS